MALSCVLSCVYRNNIMSTTLLANNYYLPREFDSPQVNYSRFSVLRPTSPPRFSVPGPASPSRFTVPRPASPKPISSPARFIVPRPASPRPASPKPASKPISSPRIIIPSIPQVNYPLQSIPSIPSIKVPASPHKSHRHELLRSDTSLNERQQAFCSCVAKVAAKQPDACLLEKAWFDKRDGKTCANPFPICVKSTGTSSRGCIKEYDYDAMSDVTLRGLAYLHGIPVPQPFNRSTVISAFMNKV